MTWRAHIWPSDYDRTLRLGIAKHNADGSLDVVQAAIIKRHDPSRMVEADEVFLSLPREEVRSVLRALADAAWEMGIFPSQMDDYRRTNDAQQAQIEYLKSLVDRLLKCSAPMVSLPATPKDDA
jgi:hypothetical protein